MSDDFRSRGVDGVPLCTDSTSDNEEEMLFQLKPQAMFEEENSRQPRPGTPYNKLKKKKKTDDGEKFPLEPV